MLEDPPSVRRNPAATLISTSGAKVKSSELREACKANKTDRHAQECVICSAANELDRLEALVRSLERQKLDLITMASSPLYSRIG